MVTLDFSDCKTVEDVNQKWLEYAKDIEPWKTFVKKITKDLTQVKEICPECEGTGELTYGIGANAGYIGDGEGYEEDVCWRCKGSGKTIKKIKTIKK